MTREEAILIIGEHKKNAERLAGKTLAGQKSAEAFNMAIEALSTSEIPNNCEDAISRQAVMDAMYDLCGEESLKDNPWRDNPHIDSIIDAIEDLPSVTPKQKMGHWIDDTSLGYHISICSNCDWRGHGDTCLIYKPKYCPNCGARMKGGAND